jgi:hypothetical protein
MKPAMTRQEWRRVLMGAPPAPLRNIRRSVHTRHGNWEYAQAALYLYNQEFGFTREDVDELRFLAADCYSNSLPTDNTSCCELIDNLADRIEALLPPDDDS